MLETRHKWTKGITVFIFLYLGFSFGQEYASTSKDGVHPIGLLILSLLMCFCACLGARQRLPVQK